MRKVFKTKSFIQIDGWKNVYILYIREIIYIDFFVDAD